MRSSGRTVKNEAEFTAYFILSQLAADYEILKYIHQLSVEMASSPPVQFALKVIKTNK